MHRPEASTYGSTMVFRALTKVKRVNDLRETDRHSVRAALGTNSVNQAAWPRFGVALIQPVWRISDPFLKALASEMSDALYFDDLSVGDRWESRARTITDADVTNFAGLSGDFDPLHVDHEFAKQSHFGRPVAHGLLGLAFLAGLSSTCPTVRTDAFTAIRDWEFRLPVFPGDTVHVDTVVLELSVTSRRRGRVLWQRSLVNQNGEVVQAGVFETVVARTRVSREKENQPRLKVVPIDDARDAA